MNSFPRTAADQLGVQQLRAFCVVYEKQSYAAAAAALRLTVPTVWEQVRAVEKRYQTAFFARRGRRIEATPAATLLFNALGPLLTGIDSTFQLVREHEENYPQRLTLVTGVRMMLEELVAPIKRFARDFPRVSLRLLHGDDRTAAERVATGEADLGLILEAGPGASKAGLCFQHAYGISYLAILPRRHPLAAKSAIPLTDLVSWPLIVGHQGTSGRLLFEHALHREGLLDRFHIAAETDNSAFTIACVRAGMGIGIVAGNAAGFLTSKLVCRSLSRTLGRAHILFVWKQGRQLTSTIHSLMDLITMSAQK
jgi:DNA-binding transcriptional LysR family regulator